MAARRLSRKVVSRNLSGTGSNAQFTGTPYTRTLGPDGLAREREQGRARMMEEVAGLGSENRRAIRDMQGQEGPDFQSHDGNDDGGNDDHDNNWEDLPTDESEDFASAIRDVIDQGNLRYNRDTRTWKQRIDRLNENWRPRIREMSEAYLQWKYSTQGPSDNQAMRVDTSYDFNIQVLDLYTLSTSAIICRDPESPSVAHALALAGFIPSSPESPTLAISIRTLELYRRIRLRKGSFSIEAFAKVLCDCYNIPYMRRYKPALSNSFDAYLAVLREVDGRVMKALGRDDENWRVKNACKACSYELEEEPTLTFRRMVAMDANFSLKRMISRSRTQADTRVFRESDYYLADQEVARFENEITRTVRGPVVPLNHGNGQSSVEDESVVQESAEGDPADGEVEGTGLESESSGCGPRWKAAAADEKKRMWKVFDESGIFAMACRHGMILWITDLIQSGELAKYPLAMVAKALEVFGDKVLIGYDIGCAFSKTIARSSLGPSFAASKSRCCVNAFHGYSHSYDCQTINHPNVIEGMGLEDLEILERVFSASNVLGGVTRYMSPYRRRCYIDLFFKQWDTEKYGNVGLMLHNNYKQALTIITTEETALDEAKKHLDISQADLEAWHTEQTTYFKTLGKEAPYDVHRVAYVELLQKVRDVQAKYENMRGFLLSTPEDAGNTTYESALSQTRKHETERRFLAEKLDELRHELILFEERLGIQPGQRWTPQSTEYQAALAYLNEREYHRALDVLQKLVVQRLFELHRLNLNFTGYKMRTHIAKALQARCKAIRNAVKRYNDIATKLNPPRPTLDWSRASQYSFLEEFQLLRGSRQELEGKKWTDAVVRLIMKQDLRVKRAREELQRCNIEIRRVHTAILDEHEDFEQILKALGEKGDIIYGAVAEYVALQKRVNYQILARFEKTYALEGFTGDRSQGCRKGSSINSPTPSQLSETIQDAVASATQQIDDEDNEVVDAAQDLADSDDLETQDVIRLVDYVSELPRQTIE